MYLLKLLFTTCWCVSALAKSAFYYAPEDAHIHFEEFITKYNKQYADTNEKEARLEIFKKKLEEINRLNGISDHAKFGVTKFTDLTREEFKAKHTGLGNVGYRFCDILKSDKDIPDAGAPDSFDWRDKNAVTPVKDQGNCGSCYGFSAIGHLESQYVIVKKQPLTNFSVQQVLDCDLYDSDCYGGIMSNVVKALVELGGPMTDDDYPYVAAPRQQCSSDKSEVIPGLKGCVSYNLRKQETVKQLLYKTGPIAIAVDATFLSLYREGIFPASECRGEIDHGVLLVGYGTDKGKPYWLVKNSWGTDFGEDGYYRMERSDDPSGACLMLNVAMMTAIVE